MTSWSYQSPNPCTVLVKEKQDGQISRDCQPSLQQSSTETAAPSQDQPEISSSSLGNSIGGRSRREKRQAHEDGLVDVVFDGNGHDNAPHEVVEKRILVNISIALDSGLGSQHQNVYQLQVAVPLPKEALKSQKFYAYDVDQNADFMTMEELIELNETSAHPDAALSIFDDEPITSTLDYTEQADESSTSTDFDGLISSTSSPSSSYPEGLEN